MSGRPVSTFSGFTTLNTGDHFGRLLPCRSGHALVDARVDRSRSPRLRPSRVTIVAASQLEKSENYSRLGSIEQLGATRPVHTGPQQ